LKRGENKMFNQRTNCRNNTRTRRLTSTDTDSPLPKTGLNKAGNSRIVRSSPYAIFVHASPIYVTSEMVKSTSRPGRMSLRPDGRYARKLVWRPDEYPYADKRWSEKLKNFAAK
jgi:hypothetical protein